MPDLFLLPRNVLLLFSNGTFPYQSINLLTIAISITSFLPRAISTGVYTRECFYIAGGFKKYAEINAKYLQ